MQLFGCKYTRNRSVAHTLSPRTSPGWHYWSGVASLRIVFPRLWMVVMAALSGCNAADPPASPGAVGLPSPSPTSAVESVASLCAQPAVSRLILSPPDGAVLTGKARFQLDVVEIGCHITARTCLSVFDATGRRVRFDCHDIGALLFDTTVDPNGRYSILAQPGCGTSVACENGQTIAVEFRN